MVSRFSTFSHPSNSVFRQVCAVATPTVFRPVIRFIPLHWSCHEIRKCKPGRVMVSLYICTKRIIGRGHEQCREILSQLGMQTRQKDDWVSYRFDLIWFDLLRFDSQWKIIVILYHTICLLLLLRGWWSNHTICLFAHRAGISCCTAAAAVAAAANASSVGTSEVTTEYKTTPSVPKAITNNV